MSTPPAVSTPGWQVYCFSGGYREVALALFALPKSVVDADWYLLLLDNGQVAAAHLFTRTADRTRGLCHAWSGDGFGDLPAELLRTITETGTSDGPEGVLRARCALDTTGPALAPISARGSFGRPVDSLRGRFMRALVLAH